jgi:FkbM family methyltransferase
MTRLDIIGLVVRPLRRLLSGRGYTRRFPRLHAAYLRALDRVLPADTGLLTVHGQKMRVNPRDGGVDFDLVFSGDYEGAERRLLMGLVAPGMTVVEVGANIGDYTLGFAAACGPEGRVFAFEPSPRLFATLAENVRLNGHSNVVAIDQAVSDRRGTATLIEDAEVSARSSLVAGVVRKPGPRIEVRTTTLDAFARENGIERIDLLKVDTEGADHRVLAGGAATLAALRPIVCVEFWPHAMRKAGSGPSEFLALVRSLGYEVSVIEAPAAPGAVATLRPAGDDAIVAECLAKGEERGACDLLLRARNT